MIRIQQVVVDDPTFVAAGPICARVGLLTMRGSNRYGHCIRLTRDWILTAHHVVDIPELAAKFRAGRFGYLKDENYPGFSYALDPDSGYFCSEDGIRGKAGDGFDLDYAFVRLAGPYQASDHSCDEPLQVSDLGPESGTPAHIPQFNTYPISVNGIGGPPQNIAVPELMAPVKVENADTRSQLLPNCEPECFPYSLQSITKSRVPVRRAGAFVECDDAYMYHLAHTEEGCSGAAIFNEKWELVGLHTHGWWCGNIDDDRKLSNWGTSLACIVKDAASRGFDFEKNIPSLAGLMPPIVGPRRRSGCEEPRKASAPG